MKKAIFLDRDGTINHDTGYIKDTKLVVLYPGVAQGIKLLKENHGFYIIVISNQSGITRGYLTSADVDAVNQRINELLIAEGTRIDDFYYCPFHPHFDSQEKCKCRKPSTYMVDEAVAKYNIDKDNSFFIGDKIIDIHCGINAGLKSILISNTITEVELNELKNSQNSPNFITDNFLGAVKFIENNFDG